MRATLVVMLCIAFGGCGWTAKRGKGTNYDGNDRSLTTDDSDRRQL